MRRLSKRFRGRLRLVRGHCPACSSESHAAANCGVCRGYRGPFPVEDRTLLRWSWRFESLLRPAPTEAMQRAWLPVSEPLAR
jgi:hypothetical protein